jgi:hypothetical protein
MAHGGQWRTADNGARRTMARANLEQFLRETGLGRLFKEIYWEAFV